MKVINVGSTYRTYDDNLKVYDKLPSKTYKLKFNPMQGFYLEEFDEITIKEDKIYGVHERKVNKVMQSFKMFNRNLGVILSGNKGIGKSFFAMLLSKKAIEEGYPLIIVDGYYPELESYIDEIKQECIILFDEFDKTFAKINSSRRDEDNNSISIDIQSKMLSLFDGLSQGKKMFVITCNNVNSLNDYLVNRTGRFHYHFRFEYPTPEEVEIYLRDKLEEKYYGEISKVVDFSMKIDLNFDSLRAITFELNLGEKFEDAIKDLNILNIKAERYNITVLAKNGRAFKRDGESFDMFSSEEVKCWIRDNERNDIGILSFNTLKCRYDNNIGSFIVSPNDFKVELVTEDNGGDLTKE